MADDEDVLLHGKSLSSYRVVDLKKECDKRGLSKSGSKHQLIERMKAQLLLEQLQSQPISDSDEAPNIKMKEDEKTGKSEFIKQYLERQQKLLVVEREARKRFSEEESESSQDEKIVDSPKKSKECPSKVDKTPKEEPESLPPTEKLMEVSSNSAEVIQISEDMSGGDRPARKMKRFSQEEIANENTEEMKPPRKTRRWRKDVPESKDADNTVDAAEEDVSSRQSRTRRSSTQEEEQDSARQRTRRTSSQESDDTTRERRSSRHSVEEVQVKNETDDTAESREKAENVPIKAEKMEVESQSENQPHIPSVTVSDEPVVNDKTSVVKEEPMSSDTESVSHPVAVKNETLSGDEKAAPDPVDKSRSSDKEMTETVTDMPLVSDKEAEKKGDENSDKEITVTTDRQDMPARMERDSPEDEHSRRKQRKSRSSSSSSSSSSRSRSRSSSSSRSRSPQKLNSRRSRSSSSSPRSRSRSPDLSSRSQRPKSYSRSRSRTPVKNGKKSTRSPSPSRSPVGSKSRSRSRSPTPKKNQHPAKPPDLQDSKHQSNEEEDETKGREQIQKKESIVAEENASVASTQNEPEKEIDSDRTPDTSSSQRAAAVGPRKVSLTGRDKDEDKGEDDNKEKPVRKRKWGSSRRPSNTAQPVKNVSSINISTDSLKGLIPEIKLTEPVLNLDHEDEKISDQEEDKRDVKLRRTVVMKDEEEREQEQKDDAVDEKEEDVEMVDAQSDDEVENKPPTPKKEPTVVRRVSQQTSIEADEPMAAPRSPSPARNPPSNIVHIRNLVRPFTLNQLKELAGRTGTMVDSDFWIDKIKSHCFVTYETEQQAVDTRKALHGTKWPSSNPKVLKVEYATADDISHYRDKELGPKGVKRQIQQDVKPKQIEKEKREKERETRKKEEQKPPPPIREWDRDKIRQSRERDREPSPRDRVRSRSDDKRQRDRSRERERDRDRKDRRVTGTEKAEDEPPAKLLDDLFKKTKATPCIYWLPLTEAQYIQKEKERKERQVARERIRQEDEPSSQDRAGQNRRKSPPPRSSPIKRRGDSRDRGAPRRPERGGRGGRSNSPGYGRRRR